MSDSTLSTVVTDQVIIGYHRDIAADGFENAQKLIDEILVKLRARGVVPIDTYVASGSNDKVAFAVSLVRLENPSFTLVQLQSLIGGADFGSIAYAERNASVVTLAVQPFGVRTPNGFNDPLAYDQWALATLGAADPWTVTPPAGGSTIVAIVDSGLRRFNGTIPLDLGAVLPIPACNPAPYIDGIDRDGHGTRLAGTIAALPDNAIGVASAVPANWGISLLPLKFFGTEEIGTAYYGSTAIACAADQGAKVINASWHVAPADGNLMALQSALDYAMAKGCLTVAAAGNNGTNNEIIPIYPANFGSQPPLAGNGMLTVMATDRYDHKPFFSNYGPNIVDIAAPGVDIMTTGPYLTDRPRYQFHSGTSVSAAFVSAGAALTFALNPTWTPREVIDHLTASADIVPGLKLACVNGRRLNLKSAVYGPLVVTAPRAGDVLHAGTGTTIHWRNDYTNPNFTDVEIAFSKDDGATWSTLVAATPNTGSYPWTPTAAQQTATARLRITPLAGNYPAQSPRFSIV
jgi:subtilisin family serine protease